nr:hypothetical protein [Tanacetum cinerariifolium]
MWNDLILAHEGPSDTRDTKIAALRLKFNAYKSLEGEKVNGTFTRLECLLNDLENNGVTIPQAKVNAMFVNSLPRKWLSMNQTQRANNSIKNDSLSTLCGKYNYKEDSDSDVEEDQRTSNEFMVDLNAKYHERALLANQKSFYKRSDRKGRNKEKISSKEVVFTKADESSYVLAPEITSESKSECTPQSSSQPSSSKATKQNTWLGPYKHRGFKNHLSDDCYSKPKCSTCGSTNHLTKEHFEHAAVKKTLSKLKAQSPLKPSLKKAPMILNYFKECKYYRFNDHHSDHVLADFNGKKSSIRKAKCKNYTREEDATYLRQKVTYDVESRQENGGVVGQSRTSTRKLNKASTRIYLTQPFEDIKLDYDEYYVCIN